MSVGPIFLLTEFNQDVSMIGILFAAGASCGTISAVSATLTTPGKWFFNKYLPVLACTAAYMLAYMLAYKVVASCLYSYALRNAPQDRGDMNITRTWTWHEQPLRHFFRLRLH